MADDTLETLRIDKWLWYARFCKSRSLATQLCAGGRLRLNRQVVRKAHQPLKVGDVLTFPQGPRIRVVRVRALATRRGPASEARCLYDDLEPEMAAPNSSAVRASDGGRPTKSERRALARLKGES